MTSGSGTSSSSDLGQSAFTRSHRETGAACGFWCVSFWGGGRSKVQTPKLRWIPNIDGLERVTRFMFWHLCYLDLSGRYYSFDTLLL